MAGAADLLESIAITRKSKHQIFFCNQLIIFLGDFFIIFDGDSVPFGTKKTIQLLLKAKITQLNMNS